MGWRPEYNSWHGLPPKPGTCCDHVCYSLSSSDGPLLDPGLGEAVRLPRVLPAPPGWLAPCLSSSDRPVSLTQPCKGGGRWQGTSQAAWRAPRFCGERAVRAGDMLTCSSCCYNCYNFPERSDNPGRWHRRRRFASQHLPRPVGGHKEVGRDRSQMHGQGVGRRGGPFLWNPPPTPNPHKRLQKGTIKYPHLRNVVFRSSILRMIKYKCP